MNSGLSVVGGHHSLLLWPDMRREFDAADAVISANRTCWTVAQSEVQLVDNMVTNKFKTYLNRIGAISRVYMDRPFSPPAALEAQRTQREIIFFLCRETTAKEKHLSMSVK